jgi:hypothetical protein
MPLLTTSKLLAVYKQFSVDARTKKILGLLEAIEAKTTCGPLYEASCNSAGYKAVALAMFEAAEHALKSKGGTGGREIDTLIPGEIGVQMNSAYYLLTGFTSSVTKAPFHIRFENPGEGEVTDFHLTTEVNWGQVNVGKGIWAKNRFFFKIKTGGEIEPLVLNRITGHGIDQASDMRLGPMVQDVMIYVYYMMFCLTAS